MSKYPEIEPYEQGHLAVSSVHSIYYEQSGNPSGFPIVYLHGGPGGGTTASDRRYFDPSFFRIVLLDQRGAGRSTPHACLEDNNTWSLVEDIEKLRVKLGIESWVVFGGSWGSTLSLAYAETHPSRVEALILRGIFLLRQEELLWFYQKGASFVFPDYWEPYLAQIPEDERADMISAYYRRLTGPNKSLQLAAAKAWSTWEMATCKLLVDPESIARVADDNFALAFARIECHYFVNRGFFKTDGQLLKDVHKIRHIPTTIVQGRYDMVCPMKSAWDLHRAFPEADLQIVPDNGHSAKEASITKRLIEACDRFRDKARAEGRTAPAPKASAPHAAGLSQAAVNYLSHRYDNPSVPAVASPPVPQVAGLEHRHRLNPPGGKSSLTFG
eukprot:m.124962 g.124962  ORF g.124962 m.124962 type:complete len:385 (+) comp52193_c0_seq1:3-1157(+)